MLREVTGHPRLACVPDTLVLGAHQPFCFPPYPASVSQSSLLSDHRYKEIPGMKNKRNLLYEVLKMF